MAATIKYDQSGKPPGEDNRSREDITPGLAVQITNVFPGAVNTLELLWKPPEDDTAVIAGASPNWTIVPKAGTDGTYTCRLTVDGDVIEMTFSTVTALFGLPIPAANEKADPTASLINNGAEQIRRSNRNQAFGPFTSGSAFGWWRVIERWFRKLESLFGASGHDHSGAGDNGPPIAHDSLTGVTENQHHGRQHALDDPLDHTGSLPEADVAFDDATGHAHSGGPGGAVVDHSSLNDDQPEKHRLINDAGTSPIETWSAQKVNAEVTAISSSYNRRRAVIDLVDNTAAPPTENLGDRYILDFTAGTVNPNWDGASKGDIVEFNGATWDATTPAEGWISYVDAQNKDALYIDDGSPNWELRNVYPRLHSDLTDVSEDQHHGRQHALDDPLDHTGNLPEADVVFDDATGHDHSATGSKGSPVSRGIQALIGLAAGTYHDYSPPELAFADEIVIFPIGGDVILTGLDTSKSIKEIAIGNGDTTGNNVIIKDNDSGSLPANRFQHSAVGLGDITIRAQDGFFWNQLSAGPGWYLGPAKTNYNQGDSIWARSSDGGAVSGAWHRLAVAASRLVGRTSSSGIKDLTAAEVNSILGAILGPASATDNAIARFDGTTGKLAKNSAAELDDNGEIKIKVYSQTAEPTLNADQFMAMWIDTDDSNRVYLVFRRGTGDQVKVELT